MNQNNYLVTQKSDIKSFTPQKISGDLEKLKESEEKSKSKVDISRGEKSPIISRALNALSLTNPFKGA